MPQALKELFVFHPDSVKDGKLIDFFVDAPKGEDLASRMQAALIRSRKYEPPSNKARYGKAVWDEKKHPRGQPENAGEFGPGGGGGKSSKPAGPAQKPPSATPPKPPSADSAIAKMNQAAMQQPQIPAAPAHEKNLGAAMRATKAASQKRESLSEAVKATSSLQRQSANMDLTPEQLAQWDSMITEPQDDSQAEDMIKKYNSHPHVKEVDRRLREMGKEIGGTDEDYNTVVTGYSKVKNSHNGQYTPRALAKHKEIADKMLKPATRCKPGHKPQLVILIGAPGSGKTSAGQPFIDKMGGGNVKFAAINNDDIKAGLDGYEGWNAAIFHQEASDVMDNDVIPRAFAENHNMIFDITGRGHQSAEEWIAEGKKRGYDCHLVHVKVEPRTSAFRTGVRFLGNSFSRDKSKEPGRYVPIDYALHDVDGRPDGTYKRLKANPAVKSYVQVSNQVPYGHPPIVLDKGEKP